MIICIEEFLSMTDPLVIDMRTKEEYEAGHIINAINFEILNYKERKKVSILYNKGLNQEAYLLAYEYALDKLPNLFSKIKNNKDKNIVFYCARGGSRSSIVYEVFKNLKGICIYKIKNGYKSYRQFVNEFFKESLGNCEALKIYDTIGVSIPSKLLTSNKYLLIDLRNIMKPTENPFILLRAKEDYFNNRMLNYYIFQKLYGSNLRKIVFIIPSINKNSDLLHENLDQLINSGDGFYLNATTQARVQVIKKTYLESVFTFEVFINFLNKKRRELSNALIDDIIEALNKKQFNKAIELILLNYIDPMMDHFIKKNKVKKITNMKEINEYLESWSE